eukprot:3316465-Ditylum_brightwellii.AAC.1
MLQRELPIGQKDKAEVERDLQLLTDISSSSSSRETNILEDRGDVTMDTRVQCECGPVLVSRQASKESNTLSTLLHKSASEKEEEV